MDNPTDAAVAAVPTAEQLAATAAAEARVRAAAEAKALSDTLLAKLPAIATELDRLKSRLVQAATKVADDASFHRYAESFATDVSNKTAEIHAWIDRHLEAPVPIATGGA